MINKFAYKLAAAAFLSLFIFALAANTARAAALNYSNDTNITLSSPSITLVIKAGSVAEGLVVNAGNIEVTLSAGESFTVTSPQSLTNSASGGVGAVTASCSAGTETNVVAQQSGTGTYTLTPTGSACVFHASGSGGGGGGATVSPSVALVIPAAGNVFDAGAVVGISWNAANGAFVGYRVSYSPDGGNSWSVLVDFHPTTSYSWKVPNASTTTGRIKVEGLDSAKNVLASGASASSFTIKGTTVVPPTTEPENVVVPIVDETATGAYDPAAARANAVNINIDLNLTEETSGTEKFCETGSLIKGSFPAVYYCGADGKRYVFTTSRVYFTWYPDFLTVKTISDEDLAKISLGGNVTYRPGVKMVKAQTSPKVYTVSRGGLLRWISSEEVAKRLYGDDWNKNIDYIPDAFWTNYQFGEPIY
jgi:hypothetical protein